MMDIERIAVPSFALSVEEDGFRYIGVNAVNTARTGLTNAALVGKSPHDLFAPDVADRLCANYQACVDQRALVDYEVSADFPSGRSLWRASLMPIIGATGRVEVLIGLCHDLARDKQREAALQAANKHLDLAIRCLRGADWRFDTATGEYQASDNLALLMGEPAPRPVAWSEWVDRVVVDDVEATSFNCLIAGQADEHVARFRFRNSADEVRWAQCRRLITAEDRASPVICGVIVDVTDECRREMKLEAEAHRDSLTGLLNRRGFHRDLGGLLKRRTSAADPSLAVFMLDLDGFKQINDRFGHLVGDEILAEVARRLTASLGDRAVVARLGGDEYVVACAGIDRATASGVQQRITEALRRSSVHRGETIKLRGSVGLAWRRCDIDLHAMMAEADDQLYQAKRNRRETLRPGAAANEFDGGLDQMSLFAA